MIAKAKQDETIDALAWRVFTNSSSDLVTQIMELNPNLTGMVTLPLGQLVTLPDKIPNQNISPKTITLWD